MNCRDVEKFVHAYVDNEFGAEDQIAFCAHLQVCSACRRVVRFEEQFRRRLQECYGDERHPVPEPLRSNISQALLEEERRSRPSRRSLSWVIAPAAVAMAAAVVVFLARDTEFSSLAEQAVLTHRQQLPMDVRGKSNEEVRAFFRDKLPFAVHPPRLAGAQLVGARLTDLQGQRAACLTYQLGDQRVSLFVVDPESVPSGGRVTRVGQRDVHWRDQRGYNVALYKARGGTYALTSDMEPNRLVRLISTSD
jgi:anti-sigma factor RsiW